MMAGDRAGEKGATTWLKAPEPLVIAFGEAVRTLPGALVRKMFGYPCAFFNGHMFAGLYADTLFFRLAPDDRNAFLALPGARVFEPMAGRPMREYVQAPGAMIITPSEWTPWLDRALAHTASLPPKPEKPAGKRKQG